MTLRSRPIRDFPPKTLGESLPPIQPLQQASRPTTPTIPSHSVPCCTATVHARWGKVEEGFPNQEKEKEELVSLPYLCGGLFSGGIGGGDRKGKPAIDKGKKKDSSVSIDLCLVVEGGRRATVPARNKRDKGGRKKPFFFGRQCQKSCVAAGRRREGMPPLMTSGAARGDWTE